MSEEPTRRRYPGYATEMLDYPSGAWEIKAHDLPLLVSIFGENLLWALARCFEAADRLMSLGFLVPSEELHGSEPAKAIRNHFTAFWLAAGTMRELALAIMALPGMRKRLRSPEALRAWYTLEVIARRWNSDPFVRVRNAVGFHLDSLKELFRLGVEDLEAEGLPLVLAQGDNPKHGNASFPFGRDIFTRGLWPHGSARSRPRDEMLDARKREFEAVASALAMDQTRVGGLLQGVLVDLLRPGRAVTPELRLSFHRSQLLGLLVRASERRIVREEVTGMSGPDEIARAFQAATNIPRSQLYGTEHDRQMPSSLAESAQTPYVGFVGQNYREGGTVLIAVNPGGGGDTQERTPGDAALEVAILTLRDAPLASLQRCLDAVTDAYVKQLEIISIGKNVVSPVLAASKSTLAEVAFLNLFPYRTRKNATPLAHALQRALDNAIGPLVKALAPSRIIFLGKKAGDITGNRFGVKKSYTIQRTIGDRYLCAEAERVLNEIKTDASRSRENGRMARHGIDLDTLSPQEQLDLLDQLWERLGRNPDVFPLTDEQRCELDARSDELDRDLAAGRPAGIPWEEVLARIKSH